MRRLHIYPNAYYNFLKNKKAAYHARKEKILIEIGHIYHAHNGVDGYRSMRVFLQQKKFNLIDMVYEMLELG